MLPPAPGTFSISTGCPSASPAPSATMRATTSEEPPGPNGTTSLTGFPGNVCAWTAPASARPAVNAVRANGCGGRSGAAPRLQENAQLAQAAKHAGRLPLQDALAKTGYRASRSALIRVQSDPGAKSVADVVAGSSCAYLAEPGFR